jgi:peptide chain release factor 3
MSSQTWQSIASVAEKRRTFAIISHPDAGKTTLTEKLLLYSGMVRTAGMVRGRKGSKATSSDWMAMEQERGISITASAMQFEYKDITINLLDTPGHQDFSEDTYRTLTAADCAIMVIDAAKGVEAQTRKLFEVCRIRGIPAITFVNKMDLPARDIFELLGEVENLLGVKTSPVNWPIGSGKAFVGVVNRNTKVVSLFEKSEIGGAGRALIQEMSLDDFIKSNKYDSDLRSNLEFEMSLLDEAGNPYHHNDFLNGKTSPVFFGSALTNFGIEPFFDSFVNIAPSPRPVVVSDNSGNNLEVTSASEFFSGFVFKIQANMNPKHRDSMAFIRVCSGVLERDMSVTHHRTGKEVRLSRSYSMSGQDRNTVDQAFPGDVIGAINPGVFTIGDTVSTKGGFNFPPMPQFPPEIIAQIRPLDVMKRKAFEKGVKQLCDEGAVQMLRSYENPNGAPYVAAVGRLQFEVLQFRIKEEYGVDTALDTLPYKYSAWLIGDPKTLKKTQSAFLTLDSKDRVVVLFTGEWEKNYLLEKNPEHKLNDFVN